MTVPAFPDTITRPLTDGDASDLVALSSAVLAADGGLPLIASEGFLRPRYLGGARSVGAFAYGRLVAAGEASVLLDVNVDNPGATRVYERLGFVHIGRRARFEAQP